jgi:predicted negative regulator of RcsB-dependent stress response
MDEEIDIINRNTRIEKLKNFLISKRKQIVSFLIFIVFILISFFGYQEFNKRNKEKLANKFNMLVTDFDNGQKNINNELVEIINEKDKTYSPLAFFFLLDNDLISSNDEINTYFDLLINEIPLDNEIKNLTIYKKGLFNSDFVQENELLSILNPIIKSESMWKPQALYLMAEYYLSKNQKQKSKEFFNQIVDMENISPKIKLEVQKRLRSDFSE